MSCRCEYCIWGPPPPLERMQSDIEEANSVEFYRRLRRQVPGAVLPSPAGGPPADGRNVRPAPRAGLVAGSDVLPNGGMPAHADPAAGLENPSLDSLEGAGEPSATPRGEPVPLSLRALRRIRGWWA